MKRLAIFSLLACTMTGCSSIMHELQPHRMWRWNYQEPSGRTDGVYFSIDDPLPTPTQRKSLNDLNQNSAPAATSPETQIDLGQQ